MPDGTGEREGTGGAGAQRADCAPACGMPGTDPCARDAVAAGLPVSTTREVVERAAQGDGPSLELVRNAGRTIGTVLAALVNFFNPHRIVMTGGVAQAGAPLLAGIREAVYGRSMPQAARALEITVSDAPDLSGRVGAALMAIEEFFDEDSVYEALAR